DFVLAPGASPASIRLRYSGARGLRLNADGDLVIQSASSAILQHRPVSYQEIGGQRVPVESEYLLQGDEVRFRVGPYDHSHPLVIDPVIAVATYLGGTGFDAVNGVAVDSTGASYISGIGDGFSGYAGSGGFVMKLNPQPSSGPLTIAYVAYIGGIDPVAIGVDSAGAAYVMGASQGGLPVVNAYQASYGGNADAALVKINPYTGSGPVTLGYATYLGGTAGETPTALAVQANGSAFVTGHTLSSNFPLLNQDSGYQGGLDGFVTKFLPHTSGNAQVGYSTLLGGSGADTLWAIAVDSAGAAYVGGETKSSNFRLLNAAQSTRVSTDGSGTITKFQAHSGTTPVTIAYSTLLNTDTSGYVKILAIAVDGSGNAYATGQARQSTASPVFPNAANAPASALGIDSFLAKVNAYPGSGPVTFGYTSMIGTSVSVPGEQAQPAGQSVSAEPGGAVWVAGTPFFPGDAIYKIEPRSRGMYVLRVNAGGSNATVTAGSYHTLPITAFVAAWGIALDNAGAVYVAGTVAPLSTSPLPNNFLPSTNAYQQFPQGGPDGFLIKYAAATAVTIQSLPAGRSFQVTGADCAAAGTTFSTPATFSSPAFSTCTVAFTSPETSAGARHTFVRWQDASGPNGRVIVVPASAATYTAEFLTEYELVTTASPAAGGMVSGGGWYTSGTAVTVTASANNGYSFAGFSGSLTGSTNPQTVIMNAPKNVTAAFLLAQATTLSGLITGRAGAANGRVWSLTISNSGPSPAFNAQIHALMVQQTFGTACLPVRLAPASYPLALGTIGAGQSATGQVAIDFTGCPANARFTATFIYSANGGNAAGSTQLFNQFQ
ncbi:MAG: SBBP repeat-containing protein, partial [Bryobacterales bacterium]|nr:SBBP repeat-containing protein [Bryobacterales bacterium]